jgi:hypothetical protein
VSKYQRVDLEGEYNRYSDNRMPALDCNDRMICGKAKGCVMSGRQTRLDFQKRAIVLGTALSLF